MYNSRPKSSFLPESDASSDDMDSYDLRDLAKKQISPEKLKEKSKLSQFKIEPGLGQSLSQDSLRSVGENEKISDAQEFPVLPDSEIERMADPRYGRRNAVAAGGLPFKKLMQMRQVTHAKLPADSKLIRDLLAKCPLFSELTNKDLLLIPPMFKPENFVKGDAILDANETSDKLYIVKQGTLSFPPTKTSPPGSIFNAQNLLHPTPNPTPITCLSPSCALFTLSRQTYLHILQKLNHAKRQKFITLLSSVKIIGSLTITEKLALSDSIKIEKFNSGDLIFQQNSEANNFYILLSGTCIAVRDEEGGKQRIVKEYGPGDYFGEAALISNFLRRASVIAEVEVEVYCVGREVFERVVGGYVEHMPMKYSVRNIGEIFDMI
jgi:CRP-like cAMP-binding protein